MSGNNSYVFKRCFDNYSAIDKIIPLGSKRSREKKHFKNSSFHGDKSFWPNLPGVIECDKTHGTM